MAMKYEGTKMLAYSNTVDSRSNVFQGKFVVRVKSCYSHYIKIIEKAAWEQIEILLEKGFCYRRSR